MNLRVTAQSADNKFKADAVAMTALRKIAADSINNMNVSLRGCATNLDSLSAEALVARHQEVTATFTKEFKIGGVAATTIDEKSAVKTKVVVSSLDQARVKAAQIGGKK